MPAVLLLLSLLIRATAFSGMLNEGEFCVTTKSSVGGDDARPLLVFVHINKAGGSWLRSYLGWFAEQGGLHWLSQGLEQDALHSSKKTLLTSNDLETLNGLDIVNGAWGYCGLVKRPCAYLTHLRDPREIALSHYQYFCLLGKEGRKLWGPGWDSCDMSIGEWFAHCCHWKDGADLGILAYKLVRNVNQPGPAVGCVHTIQHQRALSTAVHNLLSPCTRYVINNNDPAQSLRRMVGLLTALFPEAAARAYNGSGNTSGNGFLGSGAERLNAAPRDGVDIQANREWVQRHTAVDQAVFQLGEMQLEDTWARGIEFC